MTAKNILYFRLSQLNSSAIYLPIIYLKEYANNDKYYVVDFFDLDNNSLIVKVYKDVVAEFINNNTITRPLPFLVRARLELQKDKKCYFVVTRRSCVYYLNDLDVETYATFLSQFSLTVSERKEVQLRVGCVKKLSDKITLYLPDVYFTVLKLSWPSYAFIYGFTRHDFANLMELKKVAVIGEIQLSTRRRVRIAVPLPRELEDVVSVLS